MSYTSRTQHELSLHVTRIPRFLLLAAMLLAAMVMAAIMTRSASAASIAVSPAAVGSSTTFNTPLDAAPSPDGATFYFVARAAGGQPAVLSVPSAGGAPTPVLTGAPLVAPHGIVVSTDGSTVYIADPKSGSGGAVVAVAMGDGSVRFLAAGTAPRALDVVNEGGKDMLYVAGVDPATGRAAVWRLAADGTGGRTSIMTGSPLAFADGVAVASNGTVYVAGRNGASDSSGVVLQVNARGHRPIVRNVTLGAPAGMALTKDESTLLVSSLAGDGTSQVLIVDLGTGATSTFNGTIGASHSSGGLHRARNNNTFAWCGVTAGNTGAGTVFRVTLF